MTRAEHLAWCKERAREYARQGRPLDAITSFISDLGKHEDTETLTDAAVLTGYALITRAQTAVEHWIDGFPDLRD